jgi:hypothetical protein
MNFIDNLWKIDINNKLDACEIVNYAQLCDVVVHKQLPPLSYRLQD